MINNKNLLIINKQTCNKYFYFFISLWLLIPVAVSFYCVVMGFMGSYTESIELSNIYYDSTLSIYLNTYRFIGCITIVLSFFILFKNVSKFLSKKTLVNKPFILLFSSLLLWSVVSTANSNHPLISLLGEEVICDGLFTYFVYASMLILGSMLVDSNHRKKIIILFTLVVTYCSIIMILQCIRIDFIVYCFPTIHSAMFQNSNYFGYILCMSILALLGLYLYEHNKKIRLIFLLLFIFQTVTLLINDTFGCFLACCFAIPMSYLYYSRKGKTIRKSELIPLVAFFVISLVYNLLFSANFQSLFADIFNIAKNSSNSGDAGSGRWKIWMSTIERIAKKPIFGYGPEGFNGDEFKPFNGPPHNDILQVAAYLGIPGLIMYVSGFVTLYLHLRKRSKELSSSTLICMGIITVNLVSMMFGHPVFTVTPYFWLFVGMTMIDKENSLPILYTENYKDLNKKTSIFLSGLLIVYIAFCVFIGINRFNTEKEDTNEYTDLITMKNADLTTQLMIKNNKITETSTFWYDANKFELIPINEEKPKAYGVGTSAIGNGIDKYNNEYDDNYDYSPSLDYTDMIIKVIVEIDANAIELEWVK